MNLSGHGRKDSCIELCFPVATEDRKTLRYDFSGDHDRGISSFYRWINVRTTPSPGSTIVTAKPFFSSSSISGTGGKGVSSSIHSPACKRLASFITSSFGCSPFSSTGRTSRVKVIAVGAFPTNATRAFSLSISEFSSEMDCPAA